MLGDGREAGDRGRAADPRGGARQGGAVRRHSACEEGAELVTGGARPRGHGLQPTAGSTSRPSSPASRPGSRLEQEEIFGPVLSVIRVGSLDEAIQVNNGVRYGLSSSIYTRNVNAAFRAMQDLDNGITYVNAPTIGAEAHLPFGGVKQTGNGHREGGWEVYDFYSETKVVLRRTTPARCSGRRSTTTMMLRIGVCARLRLR